MRPPRVAFVDAAVATRVASLDGFAGPNALAEPERFEPASAFDDPEPFDDANRSDSRSRDDPSWDASRKIGGSAITSWRS